MITEEGHGERAEWLAPVTPIDSRFGSTAAGSASRGAGVAEANATGATKGDPAHDVDAAEVILLRKLRARSLSISEARQVLRPLVPVDAAEGLVARFVELGYLDDAAVAEQAVRAATERKGQGRRAIAQTLSARGIPSDVAAVVLAELPDDDHERALEFARSRARRSQGRDRETDLRRLAGQLARRGYSSSIAMSAARRALDEREGLIDTE